MDSSAALEAVADTDSWGSERMAELALEDTLVAGADSGAGSFQVDMALDLRLAGRQDLRRELGLEGSYQELHCLDQGLKLE